MNLKMPSKEALRRKILADPDDEPTAGNMPTRQERLESALLDMMNAYERRVRTDCTPEQLNQAPWRCMEYVAAEALLQGRQVGETSMPNDEHQFTEEECAIPLPNGKWWVDCWNCQGEIYVDHDCGEDCCACAFPEDNVMCDICHGKGGWERDFSTPSPSEDTGS